MEFCTERKCVFRDNYSTQDTSKGKCSLEGMSLKTRLHPLLWPSALLMCEMQAVYNGGHAPSGAERALPPPEIHQPNSSSALNWEKNKSSWHNQEEMRGGGIGGEERHNSRTVRWGTKVQSH